MPRFTFLKNSEFFGDPEISMTFESSDQEEIRKNAEKFLSLSQPEINEIEANRNNRVRPMREWMWNDQPVL